MINFVIPQKGSYGTIIESFVEEILPFVSEYKISDTALDRCVNVIFFTENGNFKSIKADMVKSINVFMTHGIADKNWRDASKVNKFDYVFVSGDLWVEKLVNQGLCNDKIKLGGYTRLDKLCRNKDSYIKSIDNGKKTILFAPTHNTSVTSYDKFDDIIAKIKDKYNIIISEHPYNKTVKKVTSTQFLEADVIVGDFGSSMYEGWTLGKPAVLPDWLVKDDILEKYPTSFEAQIYRDGIGYHAKDEKEFIKLIEKACLYGITQKEIDFIDGIFNKDLRGNGGKVTGDILKELELLVK